MEAVHDGLRRLDGVASIAIDLQSNLVTVTPAADRVLDLAEVPRAIRGAGFRPGEMRLRATGTLESSPDGPRVRIDGWPFSHPWAGPGSAIRPGEPFEARVDPSAEPPVLSPLTRPG